MQKAADHKSRSEHVVAPPGSAVPPRWRAVSDDAWVEYESDIAGACEAGQAEFLKAQRVPNGMSGSD